MSRRESDRCDEGGNTHANISTGLDNVNGVLCSTRYCVWCHRHQAKPYGSPTNTARGRWRSYLPDPEPVDDGGWST